MKINYFLPQYLVTNKELEEQYNSASWTAAKIFRKTGIRTRHAAKTELTSDMAVAAAQNLFAENNVSPGDVDFVILCTQSPDYFLPTTACIVQNRLEIPITAGAFDYNLGCSGFIYGMAIAKGLLMSGSASRILLLTSETYTKHVNVNDRSTRTVFGDGAAAVYLTVEDIPNIGNFVLGSDGSGAQNLIVPAGGMAKPRSLNTACEQQDDAGNFRSLDNLYMNGPEIFAFTLRIAPDLVNNILIKNSTNMDQVDYVILHQANKLVLKTLQDKLEIPDEKFCIDVEDIGNTVSSTIPIALARAKVNNKIKSGDKVLIAGFGVGYSWGGTIITI